MIGRIIIVTFLILFTSCSSGQKVAKDNKKESQSMDFTNVSSIVNIEKFENIKEFILKNGDKMTYRNIDNNNPHYKFKNFDTYLGADIGQKNINNDPEISDFNQLTIVDSKSNIRYYELLILRKGDIKEGKRWVKEGMKEEQVYLVDVYGKGLKLMENNLLNYLKQIEEEITTITKD